MPPPLGGPYGIQVFGGDVPSLVSGRLRAGGLTWARTRALWALIEPTDQTPSVYEWDGMDAMVAAIVGQNMQAIVSIYGHPAWAASTDCGPIDRVPVSRYGRFVSDLVERYDGDGTDDAPGSPRIAYWEINNEPDFAPSTAHGEDDYGGCFGDDPPAYGLHLKTGYEAVKAADSTAQVVFGSVAYDRFHDNPTYPAENAGPFTYHFIRDTLSWLSQNHGADPDFPFFDVMGFHNYNDYRTYWNGAGNTDPEILGKIEHLKANEMVVPGEFDVRHMPLMTSEVGLFSGPSDQWTNRSEELQAAYVGRVFARVLAAELVTGIWYTAEDNEANTNQCANPYEWQLYGLLRSLWVAQEAAKCGQNPLPGYNPSTPHEPKPAYDAMRAVAASLGDAAIDRRLTNMETGSADIEAYRLTRTDGRTAIVAFTDNGERLGRAGWPLPPTRSFAVNGAIMPGWTGRVRVTDYLGNETVMSGSSVTVTVDWHPTYLAVEP